MCPNSRKPLFHWLRALKLYLAESRISHSSSSFILGWAQTDTNLHYNQVCCITRPDWRGDTRSSSYIIKNNKLLKAAAQVTTATGTKLIRKGNHTSPTAELHYRLIHPPYILNLIKIYQQLRTRPNTCVVVYTLDTKYCHDCVIPDSNNWAFTWNSPAKARIWTSKAKPSLSLLLHDKLT